MTRYFHTQEQALFLPPDLQWDGKAAHLQTVSQTLEIDGVNWS